MRPVYTVCRVLSEKDKSPVVAWAVTYVSKENAVSRAQEEVERTGEEYLVCELVPKVRCFTPRAEVITENIE